MNMTMKMALSALLTLSLAVTSSETSHNQRAKRQIDLSQLFEGAINSLGDKLTDFFSSASTLTQENYQKFLDGLKSLSMEDLQKAYSKVKTYYDSLADKTSEAARQAKMAMDELSQDIAANGSSSAKCSVLAASTLTLLATCLLR